MGKVRIIRASERTSMGVWENLSEQDRFAAVAEYLGPAQAKTRLLQRGRRKENRHTIEELAKLRDAQPAYPDGEPSDRWSSEVRLAWLAVRDAEIAAMPRPKPRLRIDQLTDSQLHQVSRSTTQEQVDQLLDQFSNEALVT